MVKLFHVKRVGPKSALLRDALPGIPHPAPLDLLSPWKPLRWVSMGAPSCKLHIPRFRLWQKLAHSLHLLSPQKLETAFAGAPFMQNPTSPQAPPYFGMWMVRVISRSVSSLPQRASTPADCITARLFFTVLRNRRTSRMR